MSFPFQSVQEPRCVNTALQQPCKVAQCYQPCGGNGHEGAKRKVTELRYRNTFIHVCKSPNSEHACMNQPKCSGMSFVWEEVQYLAQFAPESSPKPICGPLPGSAVPTIGLGHCSIAQSGLPRPNKPKFFSAICWQITHYFPTCAHILSFLLQVSTLTQEGWTFLVVFPLQRKRTLVHSRSLLINTGF